MEEDFLIKNKVAGSGLVQVDIKDFLPKDFLPLGIDLKDFLYEGQVLIEKNFRERVAQLPAEQFRGKYIYLHCSVDAIIPLWAYFLLASHLAGYPAYLCYGTEKELRTAVLLQQLQNTDITQFSEARVIIKGCTDVDISENVYVQLVQHMQPVVKSLMFGEACSSVPIYKRK